MASKQIRVELEVKDPDQFGEVVYNCSEEGKAYFKFGEYASIGLDVEIVDGLPVIRRAEFMK